MSTTPMLSSAAISNACIELIKASLASSALVNSETFSNIAVLSASLPASSIEKPHFVTPYINKGVGHFCLPLQFHS